MAMTDTRPADDAAAEASGTGDASTGAATPATATPRATGLAGMLGSGDHRSIGKLYIATSLLFLVVAGVAGAAVGAERVDTSSATNVFDHPTDALQALSLHSVATVFLFLLPLAIGIATIVVPAQVGAARVAFPRAAAAAYWTYLIGGGMVIAAFAINGGPYGGDADGVDLFLISFGAVVVALLLATVCVVTTVLAVRTKGMSLDRVPMFSWSMLVAGSIWLLTLPVLVGNLVLLYLDHHYGRVLFGGNVGVYGNISWVFGQPQVYAFAVPALGVVGDIVPVFARTPQRWRNIEMGAIAAVGLFGFGAYAQTAIAPDLTEQALWVAMAIGVLLPLLLLFALWTDTLRRGSVRWASPFVCGIAAILLLLGGALAGAIGSIGKLDLRIENGVHTTWDSGQAHIVLLAATIGLIAAIHLWAPVLWRRQLKEGLGFITSLLLLAGTVILAVPDLLSGAYDQGSFDQGSAAVRNNVETWNTISLIGGALVLVAVLLFLVNLAGSLATRRTGDAEEAELDPWEGHTLEWATGEPPPVASATPLLDARAPAGEAVPA